MEKTFSPFFCCPVYSCCVFTQERTLSSEKDVAFLKGPSKTLGNGTMWNPINVNFWNSVRHGSAGTTNGLSLCSCTFTMNNMACGTDSYLSLLCQLVWGGHWCCNKLIPNSPLSFQLNTAMQCKNAALRSH